MLPAEGRAWILGVPVDPLDGREVRHALERALVAPWDGRCRHVVTLNPEYVMAARRNPALSRAIADADLITADGVGVVVAARLLADAGLERPERVTGVDVTEWLAEVSGRTGASLFLLGAGPGVAEAAAARLAAERGAVVAGWWAEGTPAPADDEEALRRIAASGARAIAVAYGTAGQTLWIARNRSLLAEMGVRLAVGVGGTFDFLAGRVPRAPAILRRLGLEWLYRLLREPWRWRRQLVLPMFAVRVLIEWLWRRGNRGLRHAKLMGERRDGAVRDRRAEGDEQDASVGPPSPEAVEASTPAQDRSPGPDPS